ncbi:glycosyltransferase [Photorhabdus khanii]|uniref:Glycosyl transferase n=1 Tax=Photorhabdus khanii subsp. guanajuatensis TaxID=2100166 RepID=A0A4R4K2H7_9GAMM|nr:glycosyltransferase [Photorhabdus khanii]TDB60656.1 glycosyl transferase [Photorhabdus khanii subsp. guanajuatensis]
MHRKKAVFLISSLAGGGAEGVCVNIANGLAEQGWQVTLLVLHMNNSVYHDRVSDKVDIQILGINHARQSLFSLRSWIIENKPQKIVAFNYELTVLLVLVRYTIRKSFSIITRNVNTISKETKHTRGIWRKFIVNKLINIFYPKADHIVNQCQGMKNDLLTVFPFIENKCSVIYNPVNKVVENYAHTINFNKVVKENYILCIGRLEEQKAFHYAIQAFSEIVNILPDLRLKIVGQGNLKKHLKALVQDLGISHRVDFEGFQSDIKPYYLHARLTLLTSLYEGFPNILVESITLGTPVVAFDCPNGPREIIQNNVNGILVPFGDIARLKEGLVSVIQGDCYHSHSVIKTSKPYNTKKLVSLWNELLIKFYNL